MDYARVLTQLREKMVVSQTELAQKLGCSFASVNRWENGAHEPTYKMKRKILALCKRHGVETEE